MKIRTDLKDDSFHLLYFKSVLLITIPLLIIVLSDIFNRLFTLSLISREGLRYLAILSISTEVFKITFDLLLSWNTGFQVSVNRYKNKKKILEYTEYIYILVFFASILLSYLIYLLSPAVADLFHLDLKNKKLFLDFISLRIISMPIYMASRVALSSLLIQKKIKAFTVISIFESFFFFFIIYIQSIFGWLENPINGIASACIIKDIFITFFLFIYLYFSSKPVFLTTKNIYRKFYISIKKTYYVALPEMLNGFLLFSSSFLFFLIAGWMGIEAISIFKISVEFMTIIWVVCVQFGLAVQLTINKKIKEFNTKILERLIFSQLYATLLMYLILFPIYINIDYFSKIYTNNILYQEDIGKGILIALLITPFIIVINSNNGILRAFKKNKLMMYLNLGSFYLFLIPMAFIAWTLSWEVESLLYIFISNYCIRAVIGHIIIYKIYKKLNTNLK